MSNKNPREPFLLGNAGNSIWILTTKQGSCYPVVFATKKDAQECKKLNMLKDHAVHKATMYLYAK